MLPVSTSRRVHAALLALIAATACCVGATCAVAAPRLPLGHAGRWITDAGGRVVVMHGANLVYKVAPFYPAAGPFGPSDAAYLRSLGFTAIRVGVLWEALEPQPADRFLPARKENFRDRDAWMAALGKLSPATAYTVTVRAACAK